MRNRLRKWFKEAKRFETIFRIFKTLKIKIAHTFQPSIRVTRVGNILCIIPTSARAARVRNTPRLRSKLSIRVTLCEGDFVVTSVM